MELAKKQTSSGAWQRRCLISPNDFEYEWIFRKKQQSSMRRPKKHETYSSKQLSQKYLFVLAVEEKKLKRPARCSMPNSII